MKQPLLYKNDNEPITINVVIDQENETLLATQQTIAELFNTTKSNVSKHFK